MRLSSATAACSILLLCLCLSCSQFHGNRTNITVSEDNNVYRMTAKFDANKTKGIQDYIDQCLEKHGHISFVNSRTDASITLHDKTTFYIKSKPGNLEIKLNKKENAVSSYNKIKKMCEGVKSIIQKKQKHLV